MFNGDLQNACGKCPDEPGFDNCNEIECNAALKGNCVVFGTTNVNGKIQNLAERLDELENL